MEMRNVKEDNFNVNLKDLLAECVRKLKYVIITALVLALLMSGVKAVKNVKAYKAGSDAQNEIVLSEQELAGVKEYLLKVNDLEKMKKYMEESPAMKIDAHNIDTVNIQYYVDADENVSQELVIAYRNFIIRGGLVSALKDAGIPMEENYLQEFVTCDSVSYNSEVKNNVFNLIIYGSDKDECYTIANKTTDVLKAYQKTLSESIRSHNLEQVEMSYSKTTDTSLDTRQKDNLDTLIETSELIGDMDDSFTVAQLAKVDELLSEKDMEENAEENTETDAVQAKPSVMSGVVKYFVLGLVLGAFLSWAVIVVAYIVSGKLKYINELQVRYGMRCFGGLSVAKKNCFKKLSEKWFYGDYPSDAMQQEKLILSKIASTVRNIELDEVAVVGEFSDSVADNVDKIVEKLNERGIKCEVIGDILKNAASIDMLCKNKKVILAEQIGRSRIRNINQELVMCAHQNVEVVGYFTVD